MTISKIKRTYTHTGILQGDARDPRSIRVYLRRTKNFWITKNGVKYKLNGHAAGNNIWPIYYLNVESIQPLKEYVVEAGK